MPLYSYVKEKPKISKKILTLTAFVLIFSGIAIIFWTVFPILSFAFVYAPKFDTLVQPIPGSEINIVFKQEFSDILGVQTDYTKASNWFPKAGNIKLADNDSIYELSIPKLGISKAQVKVGAEDLEESLIHFTGPLPGKNGSPIIFGHSTIPWIYDPYDYKTIFTKLPDLNNNDIIEVNLDNIIYKYKVVDMQIIHPDDLSVLKQDHKYPYLTLITCVPPGTYLKRLVVTAKLVDL